MAVLLLVTVSDVGATVMLANLTVVGMSPQPPPQLVSSKAMNTSKQLLMLFILVNKLMHCIFVSQSFAGIYLAN